MQRISALYGRLERHRQRILRISTTLVVNVVVLAANMASGVITARGLDPSGRGDLLVISMWPQIVASAFTFGMPAALVYEVQRRTVAPGVVFAATCAIIVGTAAVTAALFALGMPWLMAGRSPEAIQFAQAFLGITPIVSLSLVSLAFFQATESFPIYNGLRVAAPVLVIVVLLLVQATVGLRPATAALSYAAALVCTTGAALALAAPQIARSAGQLLAHGREAAGRLIRYGLSHAVTDLMGGIEVNLDKIILAGLLSVRELGLYAVAYGSSRAMLAGASAIAAVEFPRAAGLSGPEALRAMGRNAGLAALVGSLPLVVGLALAGPLLALVYGSSFLAAATLLRLFVVEAYILGIVYVLVHAFLAAGLPAITSRVQTAGTILSACAILGGAWLDGAVGAASGMVAVASLKAIVLSTALVRTQRGPVAMASGTAT